MTEFILFYITLSQKWMKLKVRMEGAEREIVSRMRLFPDQMKSLFLMSKWQHSNKSHYFSMYD